VSVDADLTSAGTAGFRIAPTPVDGTSIASVGVDTATCAACLAEVFDPSSRRFRHPFTSCADCGTAADIRIEKSAVVGEGFVHFARPVREWWNDVVFT